MWKATIGKSQLSDGLRDVNHALITEFKYNYIDKEQSL